MHLSSLGAISTADAQNMVTAIFQKDFGRTPAASGMSFWVGNLQNGTVTPSNLEQQILLDASSADLAYYHSLSTPKTSAAPAPAPVAAPKSSNLTTSANINAEAAANPNAIIMVPGVSDYAAIQKTVMQDVGESGGEISVAQGWVYLTGHTDQWWQQVQAAYTAGKSPTATTFPDTWLNSVPMTLAAKGSAQAIANLKPALPAYIQFLRDLSTPDSTINAELAAMGVNQQGQAIGTTPAPTSAAPTPSPMQAPAPSPTPASATTTAAPGVYGTVANNQGKTPATGPGYAPIAAPVPTPAPSTTAASSSPITTSQSFNLPSSGGGYIPPAPAPAPTSTPGTAGIGGISPIELGVLAVGAFLLLNRKK